MLNSNLNKPIYESYDFVYVWEVMNLEDKNFFQVENNSINFWQLQLVTQLEGEVLQSSLSFNEKEDSISGSNLFFNSDQFSFTTNGNPLPQKDKFYLYSKKPWNETTPDFYYLDNNSAVYDNDLNQHSGSQLFDIHFQNIKIIKSYNNNFFNFEKYKPKVQTPIEEINITFANNVLIGQISVLADIKSKRTEKIHKNVYLPLKDNNKNKSLSLFANPVNVEKDNFKLYLSTLKIMQDMQINELPFFTTTTGEINMLLYLSQNVETGETGVFRKVQNNLSDVIKDLIFVTQTLASNFSNKDELTSRSGKTDSKEQREWFQTEIFNGNDPQKYNDLKIQNQYEQLIIFGAKELAMKFLTIIIALSSQIKSSYCWKGGLTEEHKLFLPFYFYYVNNKFYLLSETYKIAEDTRIIESKNNYALSKKDFEISNKIISLPSLPIELEAQNISNSPLDFNENSFNFNYPVTLFFSNDSLDPFNNLFGYRAGFAANNSPGEVKFFKTKEYQRAAGDESTIPSSLEELERMLRSSENISNDFISQGDLKVVDKLRTATPTSTGSSYNTGFVAVWHYKIEGTFIKKKNLVYSTDIKYVFQNEEQFDQFLLSRFHLFQEPINLKLAYDFSFGGFDIMKIKKIIIKNIFGKEIELSFKGFDKRKINLFSKYNKKNTTTIINF